MNAVRPAEVHRWVTDELARINATYGALVTVSAVDTGDVLLTISDPTGRGWDGIARLNDVRSDDRALEFTVFFSAAPPRHVGRPVHLWGIDLRDDGQRIKVSMDTPWRDLDRSGAPALQGGIERLVRGDFSPSRAPFRGPPPVEAYGG